METQIHTFLNLALDGGEWSASRPGHSIPSKEPQDPLAWRLGGPHSQSGNHGKE